MTKLPISACIIAKNEEKHIGECLSRLAPYGFEIIVVDTGSADATKEIAGKWADKVLDFTWIDDFSAARNYAASQASHDWILAIDCDEVMQQMDRKTIGKLMQEQPELIGMMELDNVIRFGDGTKGFSKDYVMRLYNRRYYRYEQPIHEQLTAVGAQAAAVPVMLPMKAIHYGYDLSPEEMTAKQERNLALLQHQLEAGGESAYLYFQLGQSFLILGRSQEAIACYERGLAYQEPCTLLYVQYMIEGLAKAYIMAGRRADALKLMDRYASECESAKYVFFHASVLMDNQEPLRALAKYVQATLMKDADTLGDELLFCYRHIIELYHHFGEDALAEPFREKYEQCLKNKESRK